MPSGRRSSTLDSRLKAVRGSTSEADVVAALADPAPVVVEAAAQRAKGPKAEEALVHAYFRLDEGAPSADPGCWARMTILQALGRLEARSADKAALRAVRSVQVEPVGHGLTDTATGLRVAAAGLLASLRPAGALLDLAWLLHDFEPNAPCSRAERPFAKLAARTAAARAIGALGDPAGAAVLHVKLAFPGEELAEVLAACMDGLAELREPRAVELLAPWLEHRDPYLAASAGAALATAAGAAAVPLLVAALERVPAEAREPLVYALASIRADAARTALLGLVDHPDARVRQAAREVTGP